MREDTKECSFNLDSQYVELAAEVFSMLSDATRIRIILALRDGELAVGDLADRVGKPPTVVSQHLAKLRWARIVQARQEGTRVFYNLIDEHARQLVIHAVFQAEHAVEVLPQHHLDVHGVPARAGHERPAPKGRS
jgi:DNA-binding transcriptional ArsR family regulator